MKQAKRIGAIVLVLLLIGLYIATLLSAFLVPVITESLFMACAFSTIAIPIMIYGYILVYKLLKDRNNTIVEEEKEEAN